MKSRRARITPEQAGLPAYGTNRRVQGLRRAITAYKVYRGNSSGKESLVTSLGVLTTYQDTATVRRARLSFYHSGGLGGREPTFD